MGRQERDVHARFHYVALHDSPVGRRFAARDLARRVSGRISARFLRLTF
jgi:hypothetical protein